jgi:hypothetical protein
MYKCGEVVHQLVSEDAEMKKPRTGGTRGCLRFLWGNNDEEGNPIKAV